jgi:uncharacterized protein YdeI (YjbR/CyaY-like superfamily)
MIVPDDLVAALVTDARARLHFLGFPPSKRRTILYWITGAKRPETRARRIAETVRLAADNWSAAPTSPPRMSVRERTLASSVRRRSAA